MPTSADTYSGVHAACPAAALWTSSTSLRNRAENVPQSIITYSRIATALHATGRLLGFGWSALLTSMCIRVFACTPDKCFAVAACCAHVAQLFLQARAAVLAASNRREPAEDFTRALMHQTACEPHGHAALALNMQRSLRLLWCVSAAASLRAGFLSHSIPALRTWPPRRTGEVSCCGRSRALSCACGMGLGLGNTTLAVHAAGAFWHEAGPGGEVLGSHSRESPDIAAVHVHSAVSAEL